MKTVFKYPIKIQDNIAIELPKGAQILDVQEQGNGAQLWALVDTTQAKEVRKFRLFGTGHPVTGAGKYVKTFQMSKGALVFHLFKAK